MLGSKITCPFNFPLENIKWPEVICEQYSCNLVSDSNLFSVYTPSTLSISDYCVKFEDDVCQEYEHFRDLVTLVTLTRHFEDGEVTRDVTHPILNKGNLLLPRSLSLLKNHTCRPIDLSKLLGCSDMVSSYYYFVKILSNMNLRVMRNNQVLQLFELSFRKCSELSGYVLDCQNPGTINIKYNLQHKGPYNSPALLLSEYIVVAVDPETNTMLRMNQLIAATATPGGLIIILLIVLLIKRIIPRRTLIERLETPEVIRLPGRQMVIPLEE
jgi:hypothetical protein